MRDLPDLQGQVVSLTTFRLEMAEAYARWLSDEYVQRMAGEQAASPEQVIERHRAWTHTETFLAYIVVDRATGLPIGDVSLDFSHPDPHLGIMIGEPAFRGGGRAAEAVRMITQVARDRGADRIIAEIYDFNDRSLTFHERLGFVRVEHDTNIGQWVCALRLSDLD